jgi:hypothetical protein
MHLPTATCDRYSVKKSPYAILYLHQESTFTNSATRANFNAYRHSRIQHLEANNMLLIQLAGVIAILVLGVLARPPLERISN